MRGNMQSLSCHLVRGDCRTFGKSLAGNLVGHMQQVLLGHRFGDDIGAREFPSLEFVVGFDPIGPDTFSRLGL